MTLSELRAELRARGFDYEDDNSRVDRWINQAMHELCEESAWPFLETSTTGTAPLTISDLRTVLSVTDTTQESVLHGMDRRDVVDLDPAVDQTGTPTNYFIDNLTIRVYPQNTSNTIAVRYIKVPADLSASGDSPVVPTRYQDLIVDGAVVKAYKDDDQLESAIAVKQAYEAGLLKMRRSLQHRDFATAGGMTITDSEGWSVG